MQKEVQELKVQGCEPHLAVVRVGEDPASASYVKGKGKAAERLGLSFSEHHLPASTDEATLKNKLKELNQDPLVHGILLQLPLPSHLEEEPFLRLIRADKDVDGFHPFNMGCLLRGEPEAVAPATPAGIREMLLRSGHDPAGKHVVIVGRSNIVGKPLAALLVQKARGGNATVTVCHTRTPDLAQHTLLADILVAAVGRPGTITANMVRPGAVVIDVGVNRVEDASRPRGYRLVGDVEFEKVSEVAGAITPVPGGVGPLTIAMVVASTLKAAQASLREKD